MGGGDPGAARSLVNGPSVPGGLRNALSAPKPHPRRPGPRRLDYAPSVPGVNFLNRLAPA